MTVSFTRLSLPKPTGPLFASRYGRLLLPGLRSELWWAPTAGTGPSAIRSST